MSLDQHRLIFVGGLHRSGTSPLARLVSAHPQVSGLRDTGKTEDEGQHLQSVYPPASSYGGPGHFARDPRAHLVETSPLVCAQSALALRQAWDPYWDLSAPNLLEKSPPNLVMGRFLQALFPGSALVMVIRHPVTVALSTKKWTRLLSRDPRRYASLRKLVEHWLIAHRLLIEDLPYLREVRVVRYEALVTHPEATLGAVADFLHLDGAICAAGVTGSHGTSYQRMWDRLASPRRPGNRQRRHIIEDFGPQIGQYGYSVEDLSYFNPTPSTLLT